MSGHDYVGWREASLASGLDVPTLRRLVWDGRLQLRIVVDPWGSLEGLSARSFFAWLEYENERFFTAKLEEGAIEKMLADWEADGADEDTPTPVTTCPECGGPLPAQTGPGHPRRYCSTRCGDRSRKRMDRERDMA